MPSSSTSGRGSTATPPTRPGRWCSGAPPPTSARRRSSTGSRGVHDAVREAQAAAVETVAPSVTAEAVDAAAREAIENAGYGGRFVHRTGHGVGLDVREEPDLVAGNDRPLEEGMVFSVGPGIYLPRSFGVRIEDLVAVTSDGCERLNHTDRGWRCR